jgi:peptidoglycan/LPS O-acetylase OafA/YrhL
MQDLIRFFLAMAVVLAHHNHFASLYPLHPIPVEYDPPFRTVLGFFYTHGGYAVVAFFFLSGFMISMQLRDPARLGMGFKEFLARRVARIYPAHILSFGFVFLLTLYWNALEIRPFVSYNNDIWHAFLNLFLANNWMLEVDHSFNVPAWSLSVEVLCYISLWLIIRHVGNHKAGMFFLLALGLVLTKISDDPNTRNLGNGFMYFIAGHWAATLYRPFTTKIIVPLLFSCLGLWYLSTLAGLGVQKVMWMLGCFPITVLLIYNFDSTVAYLRCRPFKKLGALSFSVYIWHFPVQAVIYSILQEGLKVRMNSVVLLLVYLCTTLVVAWWSVSVVEPWGSKQLLGRFDK